MTEQKKDATINVRLQAEDVAAIRNSGLSISNFIRQAISLKLQQMEA
jgi:hypothetical protein